MKEAKNKQTRSEVFFSFCHDKSVVVQDNKIFFCFCFSRGVYFLFQLHRDHNPTQHMVQANKKKHLFFCSFFSDLTSISNYAVTVILHSIWFKQTKKTPLFLLFFFRSDFYFQLRLDSNPTQHMVRVTEYLPPPALQLKIGGQWTVDFA